MNNDLIDGRLGRTMMDASGGQLPEDPTKNYGVGSNLFRKLFPSGGDVYPKFGSAAPTQEILAKGKQATPPPAITKAGAEDIANTLDEIVPQGEMKTSTEMPAGPPPIEGEFVGRQADPEMDAEVKMAEEEILKESPNIDPVEYQKKIEERKQRVLERRTWERNVNLDYIEDADELGAYLDANADYMPVAERESLASIQADVTPERASEIMKDVLKNPPAGNLNSRQLLAGRQILLTVVKEVKNLSAKIAFRDENGEAVYTQSDLLKFEKYQAQAIMLQEFMQGQVRETARALNSMKIVAGALNTRDLEAIQKMNASMGGSSELKAKMMQDILENNPDISPADIVSDLAKISKAREVTLATISYWTGSILSGFKTQVVNTLSSVTMGAVNTLMVKPVAAAVGASRRKLFNTRNTTQWQEVGAELMAVREGIKSAILMGARIFKQGTFDNKGEYVSSFGEARFDEVSRGIKTISEVTGLEKIPLLGGLTGAFERGVKAASFGLLATGDEFFKAMAYRQAIYASAIRTAANEGLESGALTDRANRLIENPTKAMHDEAISEAERKTFTNDTGGILGDAADMISKILFKVPVFKLFVPFIRTPTALLDRTIKMSPLEATRFLSEEYRERMKNGGAEADTAMAEMIVGTTLMGLAVVLYQEGSLTGEGPENFNQREALERMNIQPFSLRFGDTTISYNRGLDPFGMSIGAIATMMDRMAYSEDEATAMGWFATGALSLASYFKEAPYLTGFANMMQLIDGNKSFDRWAAKQVASFVPSLFRDVAAVTRGVTDPTLAYSPGSVSFWNQLSTELSARIPFASNDLPPRRYWDGSIVTAGGGTALYMFNTLSPLRVTNLEEHPESRELVANGVRVPEVASTVSIGKTGMKVDLLNDLDNGTQLYDRLTQLVGEARLAAVSEVLKDRTFQENIENELDGPGKGNADALQAAIVKGTDIGRKQFFAEIMEDGGLDVEEYGEKAILLNQEGLEGIDKGLRRQTLDNEEIEMVREAGGQVPNSRGRLYVPDI